MTPGRQENARESQLPGSLCLETLPQTGLGWLCCAADSHGPAVPRTPSAPAEGTKLPLSCGNRTWGHAQPGESGIDLQVPTQGNVNIIWGLIFSIKKKIQLVV